MEYVAKDLNAIADLFDKYSKKASDKRIATKTVKEDAKLAGEASTWKAAAAILRATKLGEV